MAKEKQQNNLDAIKSNILDSIKLAKAEYEKNPTNPMYSIITDLELTLMELNKL
jgi:hypothetical protein